ncbi:hypothetical protein [Streptomyces sp. DH8]|uniref:hypothetical protein n=1 Tax=Streptomyces sp. DH8 TaxID=2857008 RepID=UPI001E4625A7|nr:hypothetical protein [Streptomyces sp. DH8]
MTNSTQAEQRPAFELRCGGLHLTVQRVPGWLVAALATATGSGLAAWFTSR